MSRRIPLDDLLSKKTLIPAAILALVLFLVLTIKPLVNIPAGHRGIVFNKLKQGVDLQRSLTEGLHFIIPFVESVTLMDVRVQKQEFEAAAASRDLQEVKVKLVLNYHIDHTQVARIYQKVGTDYQSKLIGPSVEESIKAVTALYNATQLIAKRPEVKDKVVDIMRERLGKYDIILDDVSITDFQFTSEFAKAIEDKQVAEQEALRKEYELQKAETDARIAVAQAEGDKQATIKRAEGQAEAQKLLMQSLNSDIIKLKTIDAQLEAIKKWNGKMPTVTGGSTPLIDLRNITEN